MKKFILLFVLMGFIGSVASCVEEDDNIEPTPIPSQVDPGGDLDDPADPYEED